MDESKSDLQNSVFLYLRPGPLSVTNVFFELSDERRASALCEILTFRYGSEENQEFGYTSVPENSSLDRKELFDAVVDLAPQIRDKRPHLFPDSQLSVLTRIKYFKRAHLELGIFDQLKRRGGFADWPEEVPSCEDDWLAGGMCDCDGSCTDLFHNLGDKPLSEISACGEERLDCERLSALSAAEIRADDPQLLLGLAENYYSLVRSCVSHATWFTNIDAVLNNCYQWTVKCIEMLLKHNPGMRNFPVVFEPVLPDLLSNPMGDSDWENSITRNAEAFLGTIRRYVAGGDRCESAECSSESARGPANQDCSPKQNASVANSEIDKANWRVPDDASWSELQIRVIDGETVSIRLRGRTVRQLYSELGLVDRRTKRPTKQWGLLLDFARHDGLYTWQTSGASRKNQKRKESLVKALRKFFGIKGDPIIPTADKRGWKTAFSMKGDSWGA